MYNCHVMKRVIFDLILLVLIFIFPWWVSLFFILLGIFIFNNFYEFIISGVIIYFIYVPSGNQLIYSPILFSITIIISYIIIQLIRDNIILYKKNEI